MYNIVYTNMELDLSHIDHFDWDEFNILKNRDRHNVEPYECEEIFFNELFIAPDERHSGKEPRYYALGMTNEGRTLFVVFTIRRNGLRVISARDMSRKERKTYHEKNKENT